MALDQKVQQALGSLMFAQLVLQEENETLKATNASLSQPKEGIKAKEK